MSREEDLAHRIEMIERKVFGHKGVQHIRMPPDAHEMDQARIRELYEWAGNDIAPDWSDADDPMRCKMRKLWPWLTAGLDAPRGCGSEQDDEDTWRERSEAERNSLTDGKAAKPADVRCRCGAVHRSVDHDFICMSCGDEVKAELECLT